MSVPQVRFSTAAAIRGPALLAASLYSATRVAGTVWGWGFLSTALVFGVPCLLANVSMLALVYAWEKQERIAFACLGVIPSMQSALAAQLS